MFRRLTRGGHRLFPVLWVISVLEVACSASSAAPTGSNENPTAPSLMPNSSLSQMRGARQDGIQLMPVVGSGSGIVNDTATANDAGYTLSGQVNINVHSAPADTLLYVQIAADVGLPGGQQTDGLCQRATAGLFTPLALYPGGPPATLQTSLVGTGTVHITAGVNNPFLPDGARTDLVLRLIDVLPPASSTVELRTPCYVFEVK